jgi:opacity protein-like surface antigen
MTHARPKSFAPPAHRRDVRWLLATAMLIGAGAASAADFSVGLAAGTDRGRVDCVASMPCERSSAHWKLFAGYRLSDAIDVQAVVFDAGRFKGGDTTPLGTEFGGTFKVSGFGLTAGYRWEFAPACAERLHAGLASVRTRFDYANTVWGSASMTTAQPLLGLGLAYAITPTLRLGLDYDVTRFKVHTTRGPLQMLGLAAQFSF